MDAIRKLEKRLGTGAHGVVYEGYDEDKGCFVAVKEMPYSDDSEAAAILKEIRVMQQAKHPNLVRYIGARRSEVGVQLIMEYVSGGSLEGLLQRCGRIRESVARSYIRDVLQGLCYLHDTMHVCHRDIKPGNILLTTEGRCKLTDFGVAKTLACTSNNGGEHSMYMQTVVGTPWYMAPEVIGGGSPDDEYDVDEKQEDMPSNNARDKSNEDDAKGMGGQYYNPLRGIALRSSQHRYHHAGTNSVPSGYTMSADIWSVGVTLYEMLTGVKPFGSELRNPTAIMYCITQQAVHTPQLPASLAASAELRNFLSLCFVYDKTLRPSAAELLAHRWLQPAEVESEKAKRPAGYKPNTGSDVGPSSSSYSSAMPNRGSGGVVQKEKMLLDALDLPACRPASAALMPAVRRASNPPSSEEKKAMPNRHTTAAVTQRPVIRAGSVTRLATSTMPATSSPPSMSFSPSAGFCTSDGHFVDL